MGFNLNGKPFAIRSAELFATVPNPPRRCAYWPRGYDPADDHRPFWSLEVWVEGELGIDDEARATAEEMRFQIRRWADVVGQTVEWAGPSQSGGPYGSFYLGEHDAIGRARLRFTGREGAAFRFEWEGACDVYLDDEHRRDVPFSAAGWARFTGVTVYGNGSDTDESVRARLARYFDPRDYVQGPLVRRSDRHGYFRRIESSHAVFTPSEASAS